MSWQSWWRVGKIILTFLILAAVGWQFAQILRAPELWQSALHVRWNWTIGCAGLYLLGLGCSMVFWYRLLRVLGQQPRPWQIVRAYYVGQLGRYVPGKLVGIVFRAQLMTGPGVRMTYAVLTIIYEALTTLTAGAILSSLLLFFRESNTAGMRWRVVGLIAVLGVPLFMMMFPRLVRRIMAPFVKDPNFPVPIVGTGTLVQGLGITACGWALQGASVWVLMQALLPEPEPLRLESWATCTGAIALATVIGFLIVTVPSGLGVREFVLQQALAAHWAAGLGAEEAQTLSVLAVLLLRLVWTLAEVSLAGMLYFLPTPDGIELARQAAPTPH